MKLVAAIFLLTFFWAYTALLFAILIPVYLIAFLIRYPHRSNLVHSFGCFWAQSVLTLVPGWGYQVDGLEYAQRSKIGPCVMVANHQSAMDIFALMATGLQFRWLSKDAVFRLPFIGQAMKLAGYVSVTRGDRESHRRSLDESANWLARGIPMVFFPEGTRSLNGELQEFKTGAFRLAERANVPVMPIAIEGASRMMRKHSLIPHRAKIQVKILPPMHREADESLVEFIDRVRTQIKIQIEKIRLEEARESTQKKGAPAGTPSSSQII